MGDAFSVPFILSCLHFIQESYLLFGWQDFGVARFASRTKLKIRHSKPGLACKHPDDMFTLCRIALAQAHGSQSFCLYIRTVISVSYFNWAKYQFFGAVKTGMWTVAKVKKGQRGLEVFNRECSKPSQPTTSAQCSTRTTCSFLNTLLFIQYRIAFRVDTKSYAVQPGVRQTQSANLQTGK